MNPLCKLLLSVAVALGTVGSADAAKPKANKGSLIVSPYTRGAKDPGSGPILTLTPGGTYLRATAYAGIRNAALALLQKYDPATHYFVGLGRDPAPLIAFLQNLGVGDKDVAMNFPASSNESGKAGPKVMQKYVNALIPASVLASNKTIVVVDATSSGRALDYYVPRMAKQLPGHQVVKVAFTAATSRAAVNPGDKVIIKTTHFKEVEKFPWSPYEGVVSEFPRHAPGYHSMNAIKQSRPEYLKFRNALMRRMKADKTLQEALLALTKG